MRDLIKQIIREELGITEKISPNVIYNYINKLHKKGWEGAKYEDLEWVSNHAYFTLETIDLSNSNIISQIKNTPPIYTKDTGDYPPVVISSDGYIMDGMHRISSAIKRGDTTIKAYVGHLKFV